MAAMKSYTFIVSYKGMRDIVGLPAFTFNSIKRQERGEGEGNYCELIHYQAQFLKTDDQFT